jgi:protein-S-isoprenylcysteine O-methyltransferase Ste14
VKERKQHGERDDEPRRIFAAPPLLTLAAILCGLGAERFAHLPIFAGAPWRVLSPIAAALLLIAALIFLAAVRELHAHRTTPNPYLLSTAVVSTGIYRFTRNPIYVAFMLVVVAIAVGANSRAVSHPGTSPWLRGVGHRSSQHRSRRAGSEDPREGHRSRECR